MKSKDPYSKILICRNNGQIWNFYTFENALYYVMDNKNVQSKPLKLMDNVKDYDVAVDTKDTIHLVYACMNGELSYLKYLNDNWKKSTFYKSSSKSNIDYINLVDINNSVHIFYTYKQNNHSDCKIFHLYNHNNQWQYTQLAVIPLSKESEPYYVDYDSNHNIVFLCRSRIQKHNKFYLKIFKNQRHNWSSSNELKINKDNPMIKNFLIDVKDNLHFIYHDKKGVYYANHMLKHSIPQYDSVRLNHSIDIGDKIDTDYQLYEMNHKIWISSKEKNSLQYYTSGDWGKSWSEQKEYTEKNILKTKFIGSMNKKLDINKPIISLSVSSDDKTYPLNTDPFNPYTTENELDNYNENAAAHIASDTSDEVINEDLNSCNLCDDNDSEECIENDLDKTESYKKETFMDRVKRWFM